jgi:hypothetical protein
MDLSSEDVELTTDPLQSLIRNGATEEEIKFLRGQEIFDFRRRGKNRFKAKRVELNAMNVPQFIFWLERKMEQHGVEKVIPPEAMLQLTFYYEVRGKMMKLRMHEVERQVEKAMQKFKPPKGLRRRVARQFELDATISWRHAIKAAALKADREKS